MVRDVTKIKIRMRASLYWPYRRVLRNWGNPASELMFEGGAARSDEALLETTVAVQDVNERLLKFCIRLRLRCSSGLALAAYLLNASAPKLSALRPTRSRQ